MELPADLPAHERAFMEESNEALKAMGIDVVSITSPNSPVPPTPPSATGNSGMRSGWAGLDEETQTKLLAEYSLENDDDFKKFVVVCEEKGFFSGCESETGGPEWREMFQKVVAVYNRSPNDRLAEKLRSHAQHYVMTNEIEKAVDCYTEAIALVPRGPKTHIYRVNRAVLYCKSTQHTKAVSDCMAALVTCPTYTRAYTELAYVYGLMDNSEGAVEALESAVLLDPADVAIQQQLQAVKSIYEGKQKQAEEQRQLTLKMQQEAELAEVANSSFQKHLDKKKEEDEKALDPKQMKLSKAAKLMGVSAATMGAQLEAEKLARDRLEDLRRKEEEERENNKKKYTKVIKMLGQLEGPEKGSDSDLDSSRRSSSKLSSFRRSLSRKPSKRTSGALGMMRSASFQQSSESISSSSAPSSIRIPGAHRTDSPRGDEHDERERAEMRGWNNPRDHNYSDLDESPMNDNGEYWAGEANTPTPESGPSHARPKLLDLCSMKSGVMKSLIDLEVTELDDEDHMCNTPGPIDEAAHRAALFSDAASDSPEDVDAAESIARKSQLLTVARRAIDLAGTDTIQREEAAKSWLERKTRAPCPDAGSAGLKTWLENGQILCRAAAAVCGKCPVERQADELARRRNVENFRNACIASGFPEELLIDVSALDGVDAPVEVIHSKWSDPSCDQQPLSQKVATSRLVDCVLALAWYSENYPMKED